MNIGAQLYTLRDFLHTPEGFDDSIRKLAEMGYPAVQLSAVGCMDGDAPTLDAEGAAQILKRHGLKCVTAHRGWDSIAADPAAAAKFAHTVGCTNVAIGVPPKVAMEGGIEGYRTFLNQAKPVVEALGRDGVTFSYHHHSLEWQRFGGLRPIDVLIEEAPWLQFELDTYWVNNSGVSVPGFIRRLSGRIPYVHVKDRASYGWETTFAPIGEGNLEWDEILPALAEAGTEWILVEQDLCREDPFKCLESSLRFLQSKLAA